MAFKLIPKNAIAWLRLREAAVLTSRGNADGAMGALDELFALYGEHGPTELVGPEANVLWADLAARAGRHHAAYSAYLVALRQLEAAPSTRRHLSDADRDFLAYHCKWGLTLLTKHSDSDAFNRARAIAVDGSSLQLSRVARDLRWIFPISETHIEALDTFMRANSA
jgi:hypothetical protein